MTNEWTNLDRFGRTSGTLLNNLCSVKFAQTTVESSKVTHGGRYRGTELAQKRKILIAVGNTGRRRPTIHKF